ncbi:hypothetical protein PC118_g17201 [Phytophthora cactorum]|uniref:Uncharacterized protein n=1 Tax=Phytophthora cactorum TaxID=29920 RepID=A0A8T1FC64_9STRA|nr:hypothetical protein PC118_g17201 [Phytophthora cactorum]
MEQRREQLRTRSQQWHTQRGMELGELQQNKEDITVFGSYSRSSGNTGTGSRGVTTMKKVTCATVVTRSTHVKLDVQLSCISKDLIIAELETRPAATTRQLFVLIASEITDMDLRGRAAEVPPMYYRCASIVKTVCSVRVHTKGMS